jgi:hypothetical protein
MSKPEYQDLVDILKKVWKKTRVESALDVEWANYPVEVFDELTNIIMDLELPEETKTTVTDARPADAQGFAKWPLDNE